MGRTLDSFNRASGERLTGKEMERLMEEIDAAVRPRRRCASSPAMRETAVRERFACGSVFASEKTKEAMEQKRVPLRGAVIFMGSGR